MDVLEAIKKRRSKREFLKKEIPIEILTQILDSSTYAPAAGNIQNWRFILIDDEKKKSEIANAAVKQEWIADAPIVLVVCSDNINLERFYGDRGVKFYSIENCFLAIENMLLTAVAFGVDSCVIAAFDENALKRILKLPDEIEPLAIVPLGYSKEEPFKKSSLAIESITFFNEWGKLEKEKLKHIKHLPHIKKEKQLPKKTSKKRFWFFT